MATTVTAQERIQQIEQVPGKNVDRPAGSPWLRLGVRARQIALITLLVALVVIVTTAVNIANLTAVIISKTKNEASQVSDQINYAVNQELAHNRNVDHTDDYTALVSEHSGVQGLLDSTLAASRTTAYIYLSNVSGGIITDAEGRRSLATNIHMIGNLATDRPNLDQLADQSGYVQLARVLFGAPIYEFRERLPIRRKNAGEDDGSFAAELHIGISATTNGQEFDRPTKTNLVIGLVAIVGAAIVAIGSANLLLRPLQAISSSIDQLGFSHEPGPTGDLSQDQMLIGVTSRIRQLGERLAGE